MEDILKLQYFSLCSRVNKELGNNVGISDKDLSEFIVQMAKTSTTVEIFLQNLEQNGADFSF